MQIGDRRVDQLLNGRDVRVCRLKRGFIPHQLMEQDDDIPMAFENNMENDQWRIFTSTTTTFSEFRRFWWSIKTGWMKIEYVEKLKIDLNHS